MAMKFLQLAILLSTVFSVSCKRSTEEASLSSSNLSASDIYYNCGNSLPKQGSDDWSYQTSTFNNTTQNIAVTVNKNGSPVTDPVILNKAATDTWSDNSKLTVRLIQNGANKSVRIDHHSLNRTAPVESGGCVAITKQACPEWEAFACDTAGCRCVATGQAPPSVIGNLIIESVGVGAVQGGAKLLIAGGKAVIAGVSRNLATKIGSEAVELVGYQASQTVVQRAASFLNNIDDSLVNFGKNFISSNSLPSGVTPSEIGAIRYYTGAAYKPINSALRSGSAAAIKQYDDVIRAASSGLNKLTNLTFKGTVYRGATLSDDIVAKYIPGQNVVEAAFTSTSKSTSGAFGGNVSFQMTSKTGKLIEKISMFGNEAEVLFNPGTAFRVISKTFENGTWKIVMEQLI